MKKSLTLLALIVTIIAFAQAPQGFNYQATVRNSSGALIVSQNVTFKFNIIKDAPTSVPVFSETHYAPTDDLGAVNLIIGKGTPTTGTFDSVDWGNGNYYLGIELNTGNGFVAMGTTQLLSVPYALYSNNSGSSTIPNLASVLTKSNSAENIKIANLADPNDGKDAVNKNYTDTNLLALEQKLQKQINGIESLLKKDSFYVSFKLQDAYNGLWSFQDFDKIFSLNEVSSDALVVPTRGGDWDDNGQWRRLHAHSWDSKEVLIKNTWNTLLSNVYKCNYVIENGTASEIAEARFLRAFYYYHVIDLFGKVPYKEIGEDPNSNPKMWTRIEATSFIIAELESIISSLPIRIIGDASFANKDAAHFLLAKMYLNKSVFSATTPAGPYSFSAVDMNKVIQHVDAISSTLATDYWDNFKPTNHLSTEILFSSKNYIGKEMGGISSNWYMGSHYNQTPSGWNGFSILSDFYDSFDPNDRRIKNADPGIITSFGNPMGMQIGQQYAPGGITKLKVRSSAGGGDLIFDKNIPANQIVGPANLETAGVRPQKYIPDISNLQNPENDYVFFRYADALLMKAEAIVRGGTSSTTISSITTMLNSRTGITTPTDLSTLGGIYKARGNELWIEGWRRNDMIRFGTYTTSRPTMTNTDSYRLLFPIPYDELINANFTQNPGY